MPNNVSMKEVHGLQRKKQPHDHQNMWIGKPIPTRKHSKTLKVEIHQNIQVEFTTNVEETHHDIHMFIIMLIKFVTPNVAMRK